MITFNTISWLYYSWVNVLSSVGTESVLQSAEKPAETETVCRAAAQIGVQKNRCDLQPWALSLFEFGPVPAYHLRQIFPEHIGSIWDFQRMFRRHMPCTYPVLSPISQPYLLDPRVNQ